VNTRVAVKILNTIAKIPIDKNPIARGLMKAKRPFGAHVGLAPKAASEQIFRDRRPRASKGVIQGGFMLPDPKIVT
jgi:hypothetical protein